ncbi:MAG: hypothetical protein Kow00114_09660 [Kiloniellaceae bacterium]
MSDALPSGDNVIAFPLRHRAAATPPTDPFDVWMSWAESELALLGYELMATAYNWRAAHQKGLRPEVAADHAVRGLRAG